MCPHALVASRHTGVCAHVLQLLDTLEAFEAQLHIYRKYKYIILTIMIIMDRIKNHDGSLTFYMTDG